MLICFVTLLIGWLLWSYYRRSTWWGGNNLSVKSTGGVSRCHHPCCLTCSFLQEGQKRYVFFATKEERPITDNISCKTKNVIYLIQCKKCNRQYIEETRRQLNERFGEHRRSILRHHQLLEPTPSRSILIYRVIPSTTSVSSRWNLYVVKATL